MPMPAKPLTPADSRHGTPAGEAAHRREGSAPCDPCKQARTEYRREWRETRVRLGLEAS